MSRAQELLEKITANTLKETNEARSKVKTLDDAVSQLERIRGSIMTDGSDSIIESIIDLVEKNKKLDPKRMKEVISELNGYFTASIEGTEHLTGASRLIEIVLKGK